MSSEAHHHEDHSLAGKAEKHTGVNAARCYQCGKCSAGCPMANDMDYPPSVILRMLQTHDPVMEEKVLRSMSIWLCLSCEMCIGRCPQEVDIPPLMDWLRQESIKRKMTNPKAKKIIAFHKSFLNTLKQNGRLYEVGLIVDYKMRTMALTQDIDTAPGMLTRGKLPLIPEKIKNLKQMKQIFEKSFKNKEEQS